MLLFSYFPENLGNANGWAGRSGTLPRAVQPPRFPSSVKRFLLLAAVCLYAGSMAAQTAYFGQTLGGGFDYPSGVAVDGNGNVYVADNNSSAVKEMPAGCASSICVTALGGGFSNPAGVAVDKNGNIYIADTGNNAVKEMGAGCASSSCVTRLGGGFSKPYGVAVDGSGNVYVADFQNGAVKEMPAGCASSSCVTKIGSGFTNPQGVAVDSNGNVYVADFASYVVKEILAVCASSCMTTLGGGFTSPGGVAVDLWGNVYVADTFHNAVKEMPAGCASASCVTTLGGGFSYPPGVAVDGNGNVYVADASNNAVKEIIRQGVNFGSVAVNPATPGTQTLTFTFTASGTIEAPAVLTQGAAGLDFTDAGTGTCTTNGTSRTYNTNDTCTVEVNFKPKFAGTRYGAVVLWNSSNAPLATAYLYGTGMGPQLIFGPPAETALGGGFSHPWAVAEDGNGNIYVADAANNALKKMPAGCADSNCVTTLIGGSSQPDGVAVDGAGNVYLTYFSSSTVTELPFGCSSSSCALTLGGDLFQPSDLTVDRSGNIYVADTWHSQVREIPPGCVSSNCVLTLGGGFAAPYAVAVDASGNVFVADSQNSLVKKMPAGCTTSSCVSTLGGGFNYPEGLALDGNGNVYVADSANNSLKEMSATCASSSCVTTLENDLSWPLGLAVDGNGNIFIANDNADSVGELVRATPPALTYSITEAGMTSFESPQTVTVQNLGNQALDILSVAFGKDFPEAPGESTDCSSSTNLEAASSCTLSIDFSPLAASATGFSTQLNELVSLTDNNLNTTNAVQSVAVSGTEEFDAPALTTPAPGSTLSGSTQAFTWSAGSGITYYQLRIGNTGAGSSNLYASGVLTGLTDNVTGLPTNGGELFVRLYYEVGSAWKLIDYTYVEAGTAVPPAMTSPTPGSVLTGSSANFEWSAGSGVTAYQLRIGNTGAGSSNLFASGVITAASANVTGLPTIGARLNVRLYYEIDAVWHAIDYLYSESGTFAAPALTSPAPGSKLTGSSAAFSWTTGSEVTMYQLRIGNTGVGSSNLYASGALQGTTANVTGLPTNGGELFVRLYYESNNVWKSIDYTYVESGTATPPALTSPTPGSVLTGSSADFGWTSGAGITAYQLRIGTTGVGSQNLFASGAITTDSANVTGLPATGATLYVRLYYEVAAVWHSIDYLYSEFGTPAPPALTAPTPGSTLTGSSAVFSWTAGSENTEYQLRIGNTGVGSSNLFASGALLTTSSNVTGLPTSGGELFVRLYYQSNNVWKPIDYTYVESGTAVAPVLNSPPPGSTLAGSTVEFGWTAGAGITAYQLRIGTTGVGSSNLYASGVISLLEELVAGLPTTGGKVYVRLYYEVAGVWKSADYTYTAE